MNEVISKDKASGRSIMTGSQTAARWSFWSAAASLVFLAALHILSPEFDPSWRMVSEYANGQYGWVLSLMFASWAVSSWASASTIWSQVRTRAGKIGLIFLIAAGIGEAMASIFDINHPLHGLASLIGVPSLPIAAMLISVSLARTEEWSASKKLLLSTANLTWVSLVLMVATFAIMIATFIQAGGDMTAESTAVTSLPPGVIAVVGWANRLLVIVYCAWVMTVAGQAIRLQRAKKYE